MVTKLPMRRPNVMSPVFPWTEIDGFENRLRRMFDEPFAKFTETEMFGWSPAVEVVEFEDELKLTAELPGVEEKDIEIELEGNLLTLRGEKKVEMEKEELKGDYKTRLFERNYGEFIRSFTLPVTIEAEKIAAEFHNGVLAIHLPKTKEAMGRKILIKAH